MASATESLRWVKYDGVYYASLVVPDDDAPMPVESGHVFVYFLGSESGAVVPIADTSPYDPHDTSRTSHPAAAAGVLVAQQIIAGAEAAAHEDAAAEYAEAMVKDGPRKKGKSGGTKQSHKEAPLAVSRRAEEQEEEDTLLGATLTVDDTKRNRRRQADTEDEEEENALLQLHSRSGGKKTRLEEQEEEEEEEVEDSVPGNSAENKEEEEQRSRWKDMAEDLNITTPLRASGGRGSHGRTSNKRQSETYPASLDSGSVVGPFLTEIRHHYRLALAEAVDSGRIVNMQELELVRLVESQLLRWRGEVAYVQHLLQDAATEYHAVAAGPAGDAHGTDATVLEEEAASLRSRLESLQSSFDLEEVIKKHLHLRDKPPERRERRRAGTFAAGNVSTFTDASLAFVLDVHASTAVPRELTHQLAHRYREQRLRREKLLASQHGLGKTGFTAPVARVMEKWRQSREAMVLDPRRESQPVSRRYSESLARVERHALKCLSAAKGPASQLASLYRTQQEQRQQQPQRISKNIYNFHDFHEEEQQMTSMYQASSSHPYMSGVGMPNDADDADDAAQDTFQAPLISPLRTSFDPRATFALDIGEIKQGNTLAEQLAMQSMQYSHSIHLPSQESVWESSEAYESGRRRRGGRSTSRAGSTSRASSRASSVVRDYADDAVSKTNTNAMTTNNNNNAVRTGNERRWRNDWRASAKRAILEQLTLYLRGIRGKPSLLNKDQFQLIAKKLLERAVRSESERTGLSMSLQANNANAPFTKDIEARLRKSVDNYVMRHFLNARTPEPQKRSRGGDARTTSLDQWAASVRETTQRQEDDDETRSLMGAYPHSNNSPVYDEW
ncbi:uncharacterized protein Tco025E_00303 [Trypanosoma conorhini]|uniref:Uncharacterized protein n=1 Tax=Trypanosoma conorhini TaxID=83891 RepID=A0A422QBT7_9TRYP|nr:uncharacterized protein Tco025E_00303 [Trypanosoma conorhini]RNF27441.1 hypothetical protein Tco025E_00303 [Trypanosoma conorhini]